MSSLAASKSDNFYYPPEWRPEYGGISKFQGSKGANQYQKYGVIRFELPFDAWCLKCGRHMSKGLRFNAKKDAVGSYHSTTIWAFSTKCYSCDQPFVIKTNPQERTYDYAEGLRKHEQDYVADPADHTIEILSDETKHQISQDPMLKLQHLSADATKAKTTHQQLESLQSLQTSVTKNDFEMNSLLRKANRKLKKQEVSQQEEGRKKGWSNIPLLQNNEQQQDKELVQSMLLLQQMRKREEAEKQLISKPKIAAQSIFSNSLNVLPSSLSSSSTTGNALHHRDYGSTINKGSQEQLTNGDSVGKKRKLNLNYLLSSSSPSNGLVQKTADNNPPLVQIKRIKK